MIEQTEALTSIDVNTAGFLGRQNLEETAFITNMEAAAVIPRQLRLRNLGGIIVIDFIDCLLYTSPSPRDATLSRMPSSA